MPNKTVKVPNISCGHCVATIEREVARVRGVDSVKVDRVTKEVTVAWNPDTTDWASIERVLKDINYAPVG
jgi:copper chaperone CopZ